MAGAPPQAGVQIWHSGSPELLQSPVPGHEAVELGVGEVGYGDSGDGDCGGERIPPAPGLVARMDGVHGEADAEQEDLRGRETPTILDQRRKLRRNSRQECETLNGGLRWGG